jgi:hypothetical protein
MTPAECRAARGLVAMTQPQLAHAAVLPLGVIIDFATDAASPKGEDLDAIQDVLERAGAEFIERRVRLRQF